MQLTQIMTEPEMEQWASQLSLYLFPGAVIFLSGELGSGKTTLVRNCLRGMGYQGIVKSPTYALVEEYPLNITVYHFDLYRVEKAFELELIGIQDYFQSTSICFIEWPDKGQAYLPIPDLIITFTTLENSRSVTAQGMTDKGQQILKHLYTTPKGKNAH